jgi:hypothetical protein
MYEGKYKPITVKYNKTGESYIQPYDIAGVRRTISLTVLEPIAEQLLVDLATKMAELDDCESDIAEPGDEEHEDDASDEYDS